MGVFGGGGWALPFCLCHNCEQPSHWWFVVIVPASLALSKLHVLPWSDWLMVAEFKITQCIWIWKVKNSFKLKQCLLPYLKMIYLSSWTSIAYAFWYIYYFFLNLVMGSKWGDIGIYKYTHFQRRDTFYKTLQILYPRKNLNAMQIWKVEVAWMEMSPKMLVI